MGYRGSNAGRTEQLIGSRSLECLLFRHPSRDTANPLRIGSLQDLQGRWACDIADESGLLETCQVSVFYTGINSDLRSERYLFLNENSLPVLELLCRQQLFSSSGSVSFKFDVLSLFPQLVLLAVNDDLQEPRNLRVSVYRPICLTTLLRVCNDWTSELGTGSIRLFSRDFFLPSPPRRKALKAKPKSKVITEVEIARGAYVSSSRDAQGIIPCQPVQDHHYVEVNIEDESKTVDIKETLKTIFHCPGGRLDLPIAEITERRQTDRQTIAFKCSAAVLNCITEAVSYESTASDITLIQPDRSLV
jgi:hypothetical protein